MRKLGAAAIVFAGLIALVSIPFLLGQVAPTVASVADFVIPRWALLILTLLPAACALAIAGVLIASRDALAARWFGDEPLAIEADVVMLFRAGVVLVGLVMITVGIPAAVLYIIRGVNWVLFERAQMGDASPEIAHLWFVNLGGVVVPVLQITFGALLIRFSPQLTARLLGSRSRATSLDDSLPTCPNCGTPYDPSDYRDDGTDRRCVECHGLLTTTASEA